MLLWKTLSTSDPGAQMEMYSLLREHQARVERAGEYPIGQQAPHSPFRGWHGLFPTDVRSAIRWWWAWESVPNQHSLMELAGLLTRHTLVVETPNFTAARGQIMELASPYLPEGDELSSLRFAHNWDSSRTVERLPYLRYFASKSRLAWLRVPQSIQPKAVSHYRTFHTLEVS